MISTETLGVGNSTQIPFRTVPSVIDPTLGRGMNK